VLENIQVYRARLNGGMAQITLVQDLKRGSYAAQPLAASMARTPLDSVPPPAGRAGG
jgi:hypothetical protein